MNARVLGVAGRFPPFLCGNQGEGSIRELLGGKWKEKSKLVWKLVGIKKRRTGRFTTEGLPDPNTFIDELVLATEAAQQAIACAGLTTADIDRLVYVSGTASQMVHERELQGLSKPVFRLHHSLGFSPAVSAEMRDRACSGFLAAVCEASLILGNPRARNQKILVVVSNEPWYKGNRDLYAETGATSSLMVFGTGAGAVVLGAGDESSGILGFSHITDSDPRDTLISIVSTPAAPHGPFASRIENRTVEANFIRGMTEIIRTLEKEFPEARNPDLYFLHQPNGVLIKKLIHTLEVVPEKVPLIVKGTGNISGAFVPVLAARMMKKGSLKSGTRIVCAAIGEGERCALVYRVP